MADQFQAYYTNDCEITDYMVRMLDIESGDRILEPCGGAGAFIDAIMRNCGSPRIDTCDIDPNAVGKLQEKYGDNKAISVRQADVLFDDFFDQVAKSPIYDKIIGNPPYGAWQDYDRRAELKKKFPELYVKETYTLFLYRCLSLLRDGGKLCFIIPDTFLFLHMHEYLRRFILENTQINEILIFPSKLFPEVSFGYSNLCIITLTKYDKDSALNNTIDIYKGFRHTSEFHGSFDLPHISSFHLRQANILRGESCSFILSDNLIFVVINSKLEKLGDIANCATGIYTGDNKRFIRKLNEATRNGKGYSVVNPACICGNWNSIQPIEGTNCYISFAKGASKTKYVQLEDEWYIDWGVEAQRHYKNDKKARFQNSEYYFKKGIGIPMVKSKVVKAVLMSNRVFDQSIVGIFPNKEEHVIPLLGILNSDTANQLIHAINPTANNSSNYLKRIPIPPIDGEWARRLSKAVVEMISNPRNSALQAEIDRMVYEAYIAAL